MRVALVAPLFESVPPRLYGGTERVVANLCQGLNEAGIETTVFASGDSCVEGELVPAVDEALRLRKNPVTDPLPYNLRLLALVAERAHEFDVIHNHHDFWMLPLTKMARTPVLTTLHGRMDLPDIRAAFHAYPEARYISISDNQRLPMPELNYVRTIHHGIQTRHMHLHEKPGKYLAFLGRIFQEKRPEWAIKIAQLAGVPLKIAAKIEGPASQQYYDRYLRPHIDGKFIEYVGEVSESEKSDFLGDALALAFPIDWPEPFGLVVLESLACGTPVLARPMGAMPEILEDGITGYSHLDIAELARKVPEMAGIDRAACRRWVEERFSLKRMTEDYIHVYRHLADSSSFQLRDGKRQRLAHRHRRNFIHSVERAADGNY